MSREYKISSIESYESDNSGYIRVEFRLKADSKTTTRVIESGSYVEWVESLDSNRGYISETWGSEFYDDDFSPSYNGFNFDTWKDDHEDDSMIKKFIYENYTLNDLPDAE